MSFNFSEIEKEIQSISCHEGEAAEETLSNLNDKRGELEYYYREARLNLEKKFHEICTPLYQKRAKLVDNNSMPKFWLTALKNHPLTGNFITEEDECLLQNLKDIQLEYLPNEPGFTLKFFFGENEYIKNEVLEKTYYLENLKEPQFQDLVFDRAEASEIDWKDGKNLCFKKVTKNQRHKATGNVRSITKEVEVESFFHFFDKSPVIDEENMDEEELASLEEEIQVDFEIGDIIKSKIIPKAFDWFSGRALSYENEFASDDDFVESDEYNHDSEEDSGENDDGFESQDLTQSKENPQCKQQ